MWKDDYKRLFFSEHTTKESTYDGFKLKLEKLANPLYKYSGINERTLANLENDVVWLSNAAMFNDPYDSALTIGARIHHDSEDKQKLYERFAKIFKMSISDVEMIMDGFDHEEGLRRLLATLPQFKGNAEVIDNVVGKYVTDTDMLFEEYASDITSFYQKRTFATCFSEISDSMLMWSHYADNHQGMVLKYEFINLDLTLDKHRDILMGLNPVLYTENLLNLKDYQSFREKISLITLAAISKSNEWSYENEWRLIIHEESDERGMAVKLIKPSCIILGARVSKMHKIMLSLEAKKKNIPIKQIKLDNTKYHLSVVDFNEFD